MQFGVSSDLFLERALQDENKIEFEPWWPSSHRHVARIAQRAIESSTSSYKKYFLRVGANHVESVQGLNQVHWVEPGKD